MSDKTRASWISRQLRGENQPTTDTASQRPDKMMASAISDKLKAGPQPSDQPTPGDTTDPSQTSDTPDIEQEARDRLDADVLAAADDSTAEGHVWAARLLKATIAIVTLERARPAGV